MQYAHKMSSILYYFYKDAFQSGIFKLNKIINLCGKDRQKKGGGEAENIFFNFLFIFKEKNNPHR